MPETHQLLLSSKNNQRETPRWLFHVLHQEFHFDLDACASDANARLPHYLTKEDNALVVPWSSLRLWPHGRPPMVFMNPPWGNERTEAGTIGLVQFVHKAYREYQAGCSSVLLLPSKTETEWFQEYALKSSEIRFFDGRINYELDGKLPLLPKKEPTGRDQLAGATLASLLVVFRYSPGVVGPPRIVTMSANPRMYDEEAVRLWTASKPMKRSLPGRRRQKADAATTPGPRTTTEPVSPGV